MKLKRYIRNHPLVTFFVLTFCISWAFWIPVSILVDQVAKPRSFSSVFLIPELVILQTLGAIGPSLVAFFLIRFLYGKEVLNKIFNRYKQWKVGKVWYGIAIFLIPIITLLSILIQIKLQGISIPSDSSLGETLNNIGVFGVIFTFPLFFTSQIFSSPFLEEFGWRGFALTKLQEHHSALVSSVILGFLWGVWHLPLYNVRGTNVRGTVLLTI